MNKTFGSLFAGVGGFDMGMEQANWKCEWQVESLGVPETGAPAYYA